MNKNSLALSLIISFFLFTNATAQNNQAFSYRILSQYANDIVFDSLVTKKIIVSIPYRDIFHPNSIGFIDPDSATLTEHYPIGSEPGPISLTYNSKCLFIGLKDSPSVKRFDIGSRSINQSINLGETFLGPMLPLNVKCLPGTDSVIVVGRTFTGYDQSLAVYNNGIQLRDTILSEPITTFHFYNPGIIYGYSHKLGRYGFYTLAVDSNGIRLISTLNGLFEGHYDFTIYMDKALGGNGTVLDLSVTPPVSLGNVTPLLTQTPWTSDRLASCYDPYQNLWCIASKKTRSDSLFIQRYDPNTFLLKDIIRIGNTFRDIGNDVTKIICWGDSTKLAVTTGKGQIVIINGVKKEEPETGIFSVNDAPSNIIISPNPATSKVVFAYHEPLNIEIYSGLGELVMRKQNANELSIEPLPNAIYTVLLFDKKGNYISAQKLVKDEL